LFGLWKSAGGEKAGQGPILAKGDHYMHPVWSYIVPRITFTLILKVGFSPNVGNLFSKISFFQTIFQINCETPYLLIVFITNSLENGYTPKVSKACNSPPPTAQKL